MARRLNIRNFTVADTDTGAMAQSGRDPTVYLSQTTMLNDLSANRAVVNKSLQAITDASLNEHAHFSRSYIRVIREYKQTPDISGVDEVFIPDGIMRITFLSQQATYNSSLVYAFSAFPNTAIADLTWNVAIANTKAQVEGDYFDIQLPDTTYYPTLYVCFLIVKDAWALRQIVSGNTCKISNVSRFHYCIHPQKCYYDRNRSHYIVAAGLDTTTGIKTRITFGVEDDRKGYYCDRYYNDLIFSLSSRTYLNETILLDSRKYIYILGGYSTSISSPTGIVQKFDGTSFYQISASFNYPRNNVMSTEYNGQLYAIGGMRSDQSAANVVEVFDGVKWNTSSSMMNNRLYAGCVTYKNKIYVIGGKTHRYLSFNDVFLNSVECFDGEKWSYAPSLTYPRYNASVAVYNDKIYVVGGLIYVNGVETQTNTVEVFDGNSWSSGPPFMQNPRYATYSGSAVVYNDLLYVISGALAGSPTNNITIFDGNFWSFSDQTLPAQQKYNASAVVYNNEIYVIGGDYNQTMYKYDGNTWIVLSQPLAVPLFSTSASIYK